MNLQDIIDERDYWCERATKLEEIALRLESILTKALDNNQELRRIADDAIALTKRATEVHKRTLRIM